MISSTTSYAQVTLLIHSIDCEEVWREEEGNMWGSRWAQARQQICCFCFFFHLEKWRQINTGLGKVAEEKGRGGNQLRERESEKGHGKEIWRWKMKVCVYKNEKQTVRVNWADWQSRLALSGAHTSAWKKKILENSTYLSDSLLHHCQCITIHFSHNDQSEWDQSNEVGRIHMHLSLYGSSQCVQQQMGLR